MTMKVKTRFQYRRRLACGCTKRGKYHYYLGRSETCKEHGWTKSVSLECVPAVDQPNLFNPQWHEVERLPERKDR